MTLSFTSDALAEEYLSKIKAHFRRHDANGALRFEDDWDSGLSTGVANHLMLLLLSQNAKHLAYRDAANAAWRLKIKIMQLGVDMMPSYLEFVYGKYFNREKDHALENHSVIVERIISSTNSVKSNYEFKSSAPFLLMLTDKALIESTRPQKVCDLVHAMEGRDTILEYTSSRYRANLLEDRLGL